MTARFRALRSVSGKAGYDVANWKRSRIMKRILAISALCMALAGCVYAGPGPSYGYYGGAYGWGGYPGPAPGETAASPG
jgi:hypothetical protein